ncbi:MAG: acetylornithine carbamoyltransferase [Planctomycetota bacterium]|nr:MAG: acetylornithine carbamoyltransferase [Planctomycetota bacterium]
MLHQWSLSHAAWDGLLRAAERLRGPAGTEPLLTGKRVAMLLLNPSLRTRLSMEAACQDLGAHLLSAEPGSSWNFEWRSDVRMDGAAAEHLEEALGVLTGMSDAVALRAFAGLHDAAEDAADPVLELAARACPRPLLNLESAMDHPHQALADALVLRDHFGGSPALHESAPRRRVVLSWAPHVKPLPMAVPQAALGAFLREGHDVVLAHPPGFELDARVLTRVEALGAERGGTLETTHDRDAALDGAHVVYAKSWGARAHYGDVDAGATAVRAQPSWRVSEADLARGDDAVFMHCLPVRRGVVVDADVLRGRRSLVQQQAAARLPVQKATLCHALGVDP